MHQPLPPFAAWAGPHKPRMLIVGEAWGEQEAAVREPFAGTAGKELWRMLGEAIPAEPQLRTQADEVLNYGLTWLKHRQEWLEACGIAFTNVLALRPPDNKIKNISLPKLESVGRALEWPAIQKGRYLEEQYLCELDRLQEEIAESKPNLLVLAGNTASWAILKEQQITQIRGVVTQGRTVKTKCLPIYHPASLFYGAEQGGMWHWRPIIVADLMKAWREAERPELVRPQRQVLVNPTIEECEAWTRETLNRTGQMLLSCDIETGAGQIKCVGFARSRTEALVIPFVSQETPGWSYWASESLELRAWQCVQDLLGSGIGLVFQNGLYDLQYLARLGLRPKNVREDTMLLHHSLHPELQKGLGFLGSIYTNEASWKLMRRQRPDTEKRDE